MMLTSIDVGYRNLGLFCAKIEEGEDGNPWCIREIVAIHRIDIGELPHSKVTENQCKLFHSNEPSDLVDHLIQEFSHLLNDADVVLIERQPVVGMRDIEQLLFKAFRYKAELVSPRSMHCYFAITHLMYCHRKEYITNMAERWWLKDHPKALAAFSSLGERKHDAADAVAYAWMWVSLRAAYFREKIMKSPFLTSVADLEQFRYRTHMDFHQQ